MSKSFIDYPADGTTQLFSFSFEYIDQSHVGVFVDDVAVPFTWNTPSTVLLDTIPANGTIVRIKRTTPRDALVTFTDGDNLTESDLNDSDRQSLFIAQEADDFLTETMTTGGDGTLQALNRRISGMADPVNAQDAVTKAWAESFGTASLAEANQILTNLAGLAIEVTPVPNGTPAEVTVDQQTGVIDIEFPLGEQGIQGPQGIPGNDGADGLDAPLASENQAVGGTNNSVYMSPLRAAQASRANASVGWNSLGIATADDTSGVVEFTFPTEAKELKLVGHNVRWRAPNNTFANYIIEMGTASNWRQTGYISTAITIDSTVAAVVHSGAAIRPWSGSFCDTTFNFHLTDAEKWVIDWVGNRTTASAQCGAARVSAFSAIDPFDRLRIVGDIGTTLFQTGTYELFWR